MVTTKSNLEKRLAELATKSPALRHTFLVVSQYGGDTHITESGDIALVAEDRARRMRTQDGHTDVQVFRFDKPRDGNNKILMDQPGSYQLSETLTKNAQGSREDKRKKNGKVAAPTSDTGMSVDQKRKARTAMLDLETAAAKIRSAQAYGGQERAHLISVFVDTCRRVGWTADEVSTDVLEAIEQFGSEES